MSDLINQLLEFKSELNSMLQGGSSLKDLSQYSFSQRDRGRNVPYLSLSQKDSSGVTRIDAQPTKKQKDLFDFFNTNESGSIFPDYSFYVDLSEGKEVKFKHRLGKGKDNFELL